MIEVDSLSFGYGVGSRVLENLSLKLHTGEAVGLIGRNGSGKTTLLHVVCGLLSPYGGSIRVGSLDPDRPADRRNLPQTVGLVFQNPDDQLLASRVDEDVAFGPLNLGLPRDVVAERVREALAAVHLTGMEARDPMRLSGGEKRRVALAGVLAMRPQVLLLDEPGAFLDLREARQLAKILAAWPGTMLIAGHDRELMRKCCSRIVLLEGGRILREGMPDHPWEDDPAFREED